MEILLEEERQILEQESILKQAEIADEERKFESDKRKFVELSKEENRDFCVPENGPSPFEHPVSQQSFHSVIEQKEVSPVMNAYLTADQRPRVTIPKPINLQKFRKLFEKFESLRLSIHEPLPDQPLTTQYSPDSDPDDENQPEPQHQQPDLPIPAI